MGSGRGVRPDLQEKKEFSPREFRRAIGEGRQVIMVGDLDDVD